MSTKDTRTEVKVGDYFNMTHSEKGNEVWDEQNRFETCQLIAIRPNGSWVYRSLWYEYSESDYPFTGGEITWSIPGNESVLIERISDPEVEGFKDKMKFLPEKIQKKIKALQREYDSICKRLIIATLKTKSISEDFGEYLLELDELTQRLQAHGSYNSSYEYFGFIDALRNNWVFPRVTVEFDGEKMLAEVSRIIPQNSSIEVSVSGDFYEYPLCAILPNEDLYPVDFAYERPWSCVFGKSECESLATRILVFTESWDKPLTWEDYYKTLSQEDIQVAYLVERDFNRVAPYLVSPEECANFSPTWRELYDNHLKNKANESK
jgi:hypothetical protein